MPIALLGLAVAWIAALILGAMEFDRGLLVTAGLIGPELRTAAHWITRLGDAPILLAATGFGAGFLLFRRQWRHAAWLAATLLSGRLLVAVQKDWLERMRPDVQGHLVPVESFAFPSAHAANATITWIALAIVVTRHERMRTMALWVAVWIAILVGTSRVLLQVHWPSDVIGGWAFGLFWVLAAVVVAGSATGEGAASVK